jgi:alkyl hydroperoxide reductase subunit F
LRQYFDGLRQPVSFVLQTGEHDKRSELVAFLSDIAALSDQLTLQERDSRDDGRGGELRSPISFALEADGEPTGIVFSGIPGGHEFNSLILAILHSGGSDMKLDESVRSLVAGIGERLRFEVFISLSCHNCLDVVQALNQFALINPGISSEMIDGGLFPELIEERDIQGVPTVYLNGELFASGKVDAAQLIDKLLEREPGIAQATGQPQLPLQDMTVIGGGPAGVSAAIYSARKGLEVTLIAERLGGQVKDTIGIENLISVPKTTGPELAGALQNHLSQYEVTVKEHLRVTGIEQGNVRALVVRICDDADNAIDFRCSCNTWLGQNKRHLPVIVDLGEAGRRHMAQGFHRHENRWFPRKAINLWIDLHEFERMGLMGEYYLRAEGFQTLHIWSQWGLRRPHEDKYSARLAWSDPLYGIWSHKEPR